MTIKHLVLPGGGAASIRLLGALQKLRESGVWDEKNLESIHAVSAGTLLAVLIALRFDMETIVDYIIRRPWDNAIHLSLSNIFDVFTKKGFFGTGTIVTFMKPFFDSRDISLDISMKDFYELTGVKLFVYTVELNTFKLITVSCDTFPDLPVLKAVHMSAAYPVLISPVIIDGNCYVDGGLLCNYPINHCLKMYPNKNEVLGIGSSPVSTPKIVLADTSLFEYLLELIYQIVLNVYDKKHDADSREEIPHYVEIDIPSITISNLQSAFSDITERRKLLSDGHLAVESFIERHCTLPATTLNQPIDETPANNINIELADTNVGIATAIESLCPINSTLYVDTSKDAIDTAPNEDKNTTGRSWYNNFFLENMPFS